MSESINKIKVKDITYDVEDSIAKRSTCEGSIPLFFFSSKCVKRAHSRCKA